jgi:hypothetical protein
MPPPPTDPLALETEFQETLHLVEKGITELNKGFQELVKGVNSVLQNISWASMAGAFYLYKKIEAALKRLDKLIDQMVAEAKKVLDHSAPVISLFRTAFRWTDGVQGPVSSKAAVVRQDAQSNLANWEGNAEKAYRQKQVLQILAMNATGENAQKIGTWLTEVAKINVDFVLAFVDPLVNTGTTLVELGINASVANVLETVDTAAQAVGAALRGLWQQIKAIVEEATGAAQKMHDARTILNADSQYPDGHWPQAVTVVPA